MRRMWIMKGIPMMRKRKKKGTKMTWKQVRRFIFTILLPEAP